MPEPEAGDGVIVDVVSAGVSFADLLQTQGRYQLKLSLPFTPGMDAAGVVRSGPPGVAVREFFELHPPHVGALWGQLLELRETGALPDPPVEVHAFRDAALVLSALAGRAGKGKNVLSRAR